MGATRLVRLSYERGLIYANLLYSLQGGFDMMEVTRVDGDVSAAASGGGIPDILIDGMKSASVLNGVIRIEVTQGRNSEVAGGPPDQVPVARLVMGLPALLGLHEGLGQFIEALKKDGATAPN